MSNEEEDKDPHPYPPHPQMSHPELVRSAMGRRTPYPPHPCHNVYKEMEQVSDVHLDKLGQGVNIIFVC